MVNLKDFVSPDGEYIIPVSWSVFGKVVITGVNNLEEALEVAERYMDDIPLGEGDYVEGSYMIDADEESLLNAQEYFSTHGATYFENPEKKD